MSVNLSPVLNDTQFKSDGTLAVGYKIYTYAEGSTTPLTTYTNSLGTVAQSNPIILNSRGEVSNPIWITAGVGYKFVLKTDADVTIKTVDNIRGVNDTSIAIDQWIPSSTPTFINASQFSVSGDQTSSYQINRRAKFNTSAGTVYGTISASVFSTLTTVTVVLDSGTLDSGLSSVSLGLLTPNNPSIPTISDSIFSISKLANAAIKAFFSLTNLTVTRTFTFPDRNITVAGLDDVNAAIATAVLLTGAQTVAGVKNFTSEPTLNGVGIYSTRDPLSISGAGVGQFVQIAATPSYTLPAGGTWEYQFTIYVNASSTMSTSLAGIAAGGTLLYNTAGTSAQGWAKRIT